MTTRRRTRPKAGQLAEVTKRDFVAIAEILCIEKAPTRLKERMAGYFRSQNPRFDTQRFLKATNNCRVPSARPRAWPGSAPFPRLAP
jgi:hypothetical protein